MTQTTLPISPDLFWFIVALGGAGLATAIVFAVLPKPSKPEDAAFERLKIALGLQAVHSAVAFIGACIWAALFLSLFLGTVWVIWGLILAAMPATPEATWDLRFELVKLTALTATLGAVVALPFTLIRLRLMREQNRHAGGVLFNERLSKAQEGLYAQRQVTVPKGEGDFFNCWEDDIVRRSASIGDLERLVGERPETAAAVAGMLSVYVRELSRQVPAENAPEGIALKDLGDWGRSLAVKRPDMEKAAQVLGSLRRYDKALKIDLRGANLQAMELAGSDFDGANFSGARLDGANLSKALMRDTLVSGAKLKGAYLWETRLQAANLFEARLQGATLTGATLQKADLSDARLQNAELMGASLQGAKLENTRLQGANLDDVRMQGATLAWSKLQGARFWGAQLQGALLWKVKTDEGMSLQGANLRGAAFYSMMIPRLAVSQDQIESLFGDATVQLPEELLAPERFSRVYETGKDFQTAWRAFQREIGQDPDNPD